MPDRNSEFPELVQFLNTFHKIPKTLLEEPELEIERVTLKKGEHLLEAGQPSGKAGFVVNGLCRQYYLDANGKEFTKYFQPPGLVAIAFAEVITGEPARCSIQAVIDTELYVLSHAHFWTLFEKTLDTNILGKKIAERFFIEKDQREFEFLHFSAKQRYEAFQRKYRAVEHLIPQYQIASYIGITPVSLSRLLAQ